MAGFVSALIGLCLVFHGCVSANVQYLQEGTGHRTQQEVLSKWGQPGEKQVDGAGEAWVYRFQRFDSMEHPIGCEGFTLHFDERQVLRKWSDVDC
jgi:hypothetical protein